MDPSASLRLVKFRLYFETKSCIAATSERAATPTNVTFGLAAATLLTDGPSALQNGHQGVQNQSTAGLPCSESPLNGAPLSVVPVKFIRSSASAAGGLTSANAIAAAATARAKDLLKRSRPRIMTAPPSARFTSDRRVRQHYLTRDCSFLGSPSRKPFGGPPAGRPRWPWATTMPRVLVCRTATGQSEEMTEQWIKGCAV